jgi:LemA protein
MFWYIVALIAIVWYTISKRNEFEKLRRSVTEAGGNIGIYISKRSTCLNDALRIAKISYSHEVEGIEKLTAKDQLDQLAFLGEKYPSLQSIGGYSDCLRNALELDAEIASSKVVVNSNIREYNDAITSFPGLLVAKICRYKVQKFIDEENIEENKKLDKSIVDFSQF